MQSVLADLLNIYTTALEGSDREPPEYSYISGALKSLLTSHFGMMTETLLCWRALAKFDDEAKVDAARMFLSGQKNLAEKIKEVKSRRKKKDESTEEFMAACCLMMASLAKYFGLERAAESQGFNLQTQMEAHIEFLLDRFKNQTGLYCQVFEAQLLFWSKYPRTNASV